MVTRRFAAFCAVVLLGFGATRSAEALTILPADVGDTFSYTLVGTTFPAQISADFDWTVSSFLYNVGTNKTTVVFDVTVENTSTINSELRAFSLVTAAPDATSGGVLGSTIFDNLATNLTGPGGDFQVCVSSAATNNCNGIAQQGLEEDDAADALTLSLVFNGNFTAGGVSLTEFCGRFQAVGAGSQDSDKACSTGENFTPVPEPGSLALLGAGIAAVVARRSRKKRSAY
jgi:hypothetical protein